MFVASLISLLALLPPANARPWRFSDQPPNRPVDGRLGSTSGTGHAAWAVRVDHIYEDPATAADDECPDMAIVGGGDQLPHWVTQFECKCLPDANGVALRRTICRPLQPSAGDPTLSPGSLPGFYSDFDVLHGSTPRGIPVAAAASNISPKQPHDGLVTHGLLALVGTAARPIMTNVRLSGVRGGYFDQSIEEDLVIAGHDVDADFPVRQTPFGDGSMLNTYQPTNRSHVSLYLDPKFQADGTLRTATPDVQWHFNVEPPSAAWGDPNRDTTVGQPSWLRTFDVDLDGHLDIIVALDGVGIFVLRASVQLAAGGGYHIVDTSKTAQCSHGLPIGWTVCMLDPDTDRMSTDADFARLERWNGENEVWMVDLRACADGHTSPLECQDRRPKLAIRAVIGLETLREHHLPPTTLIRAVKFMDVCPAAGSVLCKGPAGIPAVIWSRRSAPKFAREAVMGERLWGRFPRHQLGMGTWETSDLEVSSFVRDSVPTIADADHTASVNGSPRVATLTGTGPFQISEVRADTAVVQRCLDFNRPTGPCWSYDADSRSVAVVGGTPSTITVRYRPVAGHVIVADWDAFGSSTILFNESAK